MRHTVRLVLLGMIAVLSTLNSGLAAPGERVSLLRVPDGGLQPQSVLDSSGALHLIYFLGEPGSGDIYYVRRPPGRNGFSSPIRVNSEAGSAIATGTIRGAQLAIGKGGRIHVAWNGSHKPGENEMQMLYSRMKDDRSSFEPQRNVMQFSGGLDGGGSVAADESGNVIVAWHGRGDQKGEEFRRVWIARSTNDGKTFEREVPAWDEPTGACGCCGLKAFADSKGRFRLLYRAARNKVDRDMYLLTSDDSGRTFSGVLLDKWKLDTCPMSSAFLINAAGNSEGLLAAWETQGQVYFNYLYPGQSGSRIQAPGSTGKRKHPAMAVNSRGEMLFLWTEGTGWKKGGSLAWQIYDSQGGWIEKMGEAPGIPVWSFASVIAEKDGHFTIIY